MSTDIVDESDGKGFYLNRFYGGAERGECFQITDRFGYVQLTREQMDFCVAKYLQFLTENR